VVPLRDSHQSREALALLGSGGGASRRVIGNLLTVIGCSIHLSLITVHISKKHRFSDIYTQEVFSVLRFNALTLQRITQL
jgi:hypothetical protein